MSEKRFKLSEIYSNQIIDTENCINKGTHCRLYDLKECVELLNEQQNIIEQKNEYQRTLEAKIRRLKDRIKVLEK